MHPDRPDFDPWHPHPCDDETCAGGRVYRLLVKMARVPRGFGDEATEARALLQALEG